MLCILLSALIVPVHGATPHAPDYGFTGSENISKTNVTEETTENQREISEQKEKDYSQQDLGAGMVQKGIDLFVISAADGISSIWKGNSVSKKFDENQNITDEYGATRGALFTLITENPHPNEIGVIQEFVVESKAEWAFLVSMYIFGFVFASRIEHTRSKYFAKALSSTDLSDNRFILGALVCMCSFLCPRLVLLSIYICTAVSQYFMIHALDYIEPSIDNAMMYFFMALGELAVAAFFVIRQWYIDIFYMLSHFIPCFYMMGVFKSEIEWAYSKYKKLLTLQPLCILIASVSIIVIKENGWEDATGIYVIMFLAIGYICWQWVIGGYLDNAVKGMLKKAAYSM